MADTPNDNIPPISTSSAAPIAGKLSLAQRLEYWRETFRDRLADVDSLPQLTLLGLLTGILAGLIIIAFRLLIEVPLGYWLPDSFENFEALDPSLHFYLPLIGACLIGIVLQFIDKRHHSTGVGHVIDRLQNHQGRMPVGNFAVQFFGGAACLLTGQSVGREGPAVHMGAGAGSLLGQWMKLPTNSLRPLAGCGVAAAIAACFNTPMAGVIFAMEVVVMEYSIAGFIPVILAAVAGTTLSHLVFGNVINFAPLTAEMGGLLEMPLILLAGFFIALLAALYIRSQAFWCRIALNRPIALRFAFAGLVTGCAAYYFPQILGIGYDTIERTLAGQQGFWLLLGIIIAKLFVTSAVLGVGMPGGVIGPLLFLGACAGGAIGVLAHNLMPASASPIGFYVVLGMGAMMGATLNAPLASMMAIIELTYNPGIIFPSMLVVIIACLTTRWAFRCNGLFETLLKIQGKFRTPEIAEQLLNKTGTRQLLDRHIKICARTLSYAEANTLLANRPHWLVFDDNKHIIPGQDLAAFLAQQGEAGASDTINLLEIPARRLDIIPLADDSTLFEALQALEAAKVEAGYITTSQAQVAGIITRDKINNYYRI
ncbi:chloride channel protein [Cellvibrio sp. OA-2007]|uniref:chloride channel protein n=1 Tax=Cellvibrio sp. OA-2007 TaxID=529823 RepID=UPI001EE76143|nr:chloride channel protein [Cellvibrio sp. OA-2007]